MLRARRLSLFCADLFAILSVFIGFRIAFPVLRFLQAGDLLLDHGGHFEAEVSALQQGLERRNRGTVASQAERKNGRHAEGEVRLLEVRNDLLRDVLVVFLKAREAADGGLPRMDRLAWARRLQEQLSGPTVPQRAPAR